MAGRLNLDAPQLQRLLDVAPDAFVVTREDGVVVAANRQTEELFGYARDELLGHPVEMLLPERFHAKHQGHRGAFHAQPRVRAMGEGLDLFGLRKDGTEFPVDISLGPIPTDDGVLVAAAVRDASQRKRAEEAARLIEQTNTRRRQALELNDSVVQGLAAASMALERGDDGEAARIVEATLESARTIISELLSGIGPGDLVRSRPALIQHD